MIHTDNGPYQSFAALRAAYMDAYNGNPSVEPYFNPEPWEEDLLHIIDLGKCPRIQMLRLSGAEKKFQTSEKQWNNALMYNGLKPFLTLTFP